MKSSMKRSALLLCLVFIFICAGCNNGANSPSDVSPPADASAVPDKLSASASADASGDPGNNLSLDLLLKSKWVNVETGETMTFEPEMFIELNDAWPEENDGLFLSWSETNDPGRNIVSMLLNGSHLKDHWYEFDPGTRLLSERMLDDVLSSWRIAGDITASAGERIDFVTQEYTGDDIAEIPYIEYNAETNPEIESINRSLNQGIQRVYEDFLRDRAEHEWIEIKSYPFTSPDYLQIVVTSCIFPTYGTDGDMFSINFDRKTQKWISTAETMEAMGLDEDSLLSRVDESFVPESPGQMVDKVKTSGFLIRVTPGGKMIELLLIITVTSPDTEPWEGFYSYMPDGNDNTNDLIKLSGDCLFDPRSMDQMDPPLSYQKTE